MLVAFVAALHNFFDPIQQLSQLYTTYQPGMAALDKIFELLDEEPDMRRRAGRARARRDARRDRLRATSSFSYGGRRTRERALRDVDLHVPPGQTVALVGATGAGKSTLAKLVARFYDPTAGRVLVDGHDLRDVSARSLRSQMGIVPQEGFLFSGTIAREHRVRARRTRRAEEVEAAARAVGAHEFIAALEHGYDTEVGERGAQLSAGQRQLVAFARALIADPRILVLDEATSNVDIHTEGRIEAGPAPAARRPHGDRDRPPAVDDPRAGPDRRARPRADRRAGHARRAARRREGAYWRLYRDWAEQAAA